MLPDGTVTFLFTDIQGSTSRWEADPEAMRAALAEHNAILDSVVAEFDGHVFKTIGDAYCVAFQNAEDAANAALNTHAKLAAAPDALKIRVGIHTGSIQPTGNDYFGPPVNKVARIQAAAQPGQTLVSDAAKGLLPAGLPVKDLGLHVLKDLLEPTQVWQLGEGDFAAIQSVSAIRNNLPIQTTSFIGRENEMEELRELLTTSRLITLTGSGGTGKSRLALQLAADNLERYPDGVWFIELAPLLDREDVLREVVTTLRVRESEEELEPCLMAHLVGQKLLLIFDNCEHVLNEVCALAEKIIGRCPSVAVIATSREPLGARGERVYAVPSLPSPAAGAGTSLDDLLHFGSTALFIERLASAAPMQHLEPAHVATITSICQRLDGIPLAIELAAARGRSMTLQEIEKRLSDRFRLLTGGNRTAVSRQQTLRSLIDWSVRLLTDQQRQFFTSLGVFVGGWDLESAEHVCASEARGIESWDVVDLLAALVDKSLVAFDASSGRYRLLESMRHYALEQLETEPWGIELRERHARYFLAFVEGMKDRGDSARVDRFERFFANIENHRASIEWLASEEENIPALVAVLNSSFDAWYWIRRVDEYFRLLESVLERGATFLEEELMMSATIRLMAAGVMAKDPKAGDLLDRCKGFLEKTEGAERSTLLYSICYSIFFQGEVEEAIDLLEREMPKLTANQTGCHHILGNAYACLHRYEESEREFDKAAALMLEERALLVYYYSAMSAVFPCFMAGKVEEAIQRSLDMLRFQADQGFPLELRTPQMLAFSRLALDVGEHWFPALAHAGSERRRMNREMFNDPFDLLAIQTLQEMAASAVGPELLRAADTLGDVDWDPWLRSLLSLQAKDFWGENPHFPNPELLPGRP